MPRKGNVICGLDIGTTKVCAIAGEVNDEGVVDIIGFGAAPSKGMRKGVVINIAATVESIHAAIEEAERMAGTQITDVYAGIAGGHIRGFNSHGIVAVKDGEISDADVGRVIDAAKAVAIPMDREIIHVLPQQYIVDDQDGISEPLGMSAVRLEARVHIVTASVTSGQNVIRCANKTGLRVQAVVLEQLASALAVLTQDEKELGVCLIDIGGGTTDLAIFSEGAVVHTAVLPIGGHHISNDIAVGIRTPGEEAERIKKAWGAARSSQVDRDEQVEVPSVGGREPRRLSRQILTEIIEPRVDEIFQLVKEEIQNTGYEDLLASGVVLTGGTSLLSGISSVAEDVLGLPVRLGAPRGVGGLVDVVSSPIYSTGVGLVMHGSEQSGLGPRSIERKDNIKDRKGGIPLITLIGDWFRQIF
ncbi:MAG: cell division protein FtsA [Deltaproteobacteria bacterium]|nr:cell division protein FtsA [Deltaproteobacteria bacterium]